MKYSPYDPIEFILKFTFISVFVITLCTLIIGGLIFLVTMDGMLTVTLLPWIALVVAIAWVVHAIRTFDRERKLNTQ